MPLSAGTRVGPYEILAPLGAGGMGEVYRARDTKLSRVVAIKVLPPGLSKDPDRLARFEKEARTASALNHPNIVTIYEIGSADGTAFIAMELVEGKTLRAQLSGGNLSVKKTLALAAQFADGLAKAHSAGIVHRDLKPENLMVTREGFVKILDFGLAKLLPVGFEGSGGTDLPTVTRATEAGTILGTVGYMSPEQASGEPADFRSDQFSMGSILYEMATGKRAFERDTAAQTLSAIIETEPEPLSRLAPKTPANLVWIVERCLAKDPDERYASTRDLARDLATVRDHSSEVSGGALTPAPRRAFRPILGALALLAALAGVILVLTRLRERSTPTYRQLTFRRGMVLPARFAPDGHTVLYSATFDGEPWRVFSVRPENPESSAVAVPDAQLAAVSRSGELAILLQPTLPRPVLARAPLSGGAPRALLENVSMADWSPDGAELAVAHHVGGKDRLEFPIGKVLYESTGFIYFLRVSPRGDLVALSDLPQPGDAIGSIVVVDRSARGRTLSKGWYDLGSLAWSADGKEIWFTGSRSGSRHSVWAVTLSGRERLVEATPGSLELQDIAASGAALVTQVSSRRNIRGLLPGEKHERSFSWLDFSQPIELSGDGKTLLFQEWGEGGGPSGSIYLRRLDGSTPVRLGNGLALSLSPEGETVLARTYTNPPRLALVPTGPGETRLVQGEGLHYEQCGRWLPDGKRIVFAARAPNRGVRLYVQDVGGGKPVAITPEGTAAADQQCTCVSPDGELVAALDHDRRLFLFPTKGGAPLPALGAEPGESPLRWSSDGRFLFVGRQSKVFRVDPSSGRRELWREFAPPDPAGVMTDFWFIVLSADAKSYFYSFQTHLSELYVVHGLR